MRQVQAAQRQPGTGAICTCTASRIVLVRRVALTAKLTPALTPIPPNSKRAAHQRLGGDEMASQHHTKVSPITIQSPTTIAIPPYKIPLRAPRHTAFPLHPSKRIRGIPPINRVNPPPLRPPLRIHPPSKHFHPFSSSTRFQATAPPTSSLIHTPNPTPHTLPSPTPKQPKLNTETVSLNGVSANQGWGEGEGRLVVCTVGRGSGRGRGDSGDRCGIVESCGWVVGRWEG